MARLSERGAGSPRCPGVGETIADKVAELIESGEIAALDKLVGRNPPGAATVMRIPAVGPKTARRIFTELGLETVDEVREAAEAQRIRGLRGVGDQDRGGDPRGAGGR